MVEFSSTGKKGLAEDLNPSSILGLDSSTGYLDRMIAGCDRSQRQFLSSGPKPCTSVDHNKYKNNRIKPNNKEPLQNQSPLANIDPAEWIAERKRKFPKKSVAEESPNHQDEPAPPGTIKTPSAAIPTKLMQTSTRKKTLFEKLIEMDKQPTE